MPRRHLTNPVQRSGEAWMMNRLTRAFGRRDTRDIPEPLSLQATHFRYGFIAVIVLCIAAIVTGFILPSGKAGTANFIVTKQGGRYVKYDDAWHSVPNLASARLILNSPVEAKKVDENELRSAPMGPAMGIAFAPDSLSVTKSTHPRWSVCSAQEPSTSLTSASSKDITTTVVGGTGLNSLAHKLSGSEATLAVTDQDKDAYWLVWNGKRALVSDDTEVWNALGISEEKRAAATVVSRAVLNTIPSAPTIAAPTMDRMGQSSSVASQWDVGTVLRTQVGDEVSTYAVADDGVQVINETIARLLINSGAEEYTDAPVSVIARLKSVHHIDTGGFPASPPLIIAGKTVCSTWQKDGTTPAQFSVSVAPKLPLNEDQQPAELLPSQGATLRADNAYLTAGDNWLVNIIGSDRDDVAGAQSWFITPNGVRYAIGAGTQNADPRGALGLGSVTPVPMPWSMAQLLTEGESLTFANALVYTDRSFDSPNQKPAPREGGQ
ncbi:type VII secretion protein EccB [Gordonia alkaliphila]|uniref:type VII secretion protein EccB n=1 Tax=Gordonia alkaliphila TaxID=1053547 RepID=UPI001FF4BF7B|nr:type VII secretion protein EccB [Gordonia alkaliphila]MCK0441137.1 type VII secretion protein EccB [Gordonia alkaliphila]